MIQGKDLCLLLLYGTLPPLEEYTQREASRRSVTSWYYRLTVGSIHQPNSGKVSTGYHQNSPMNQHQVMTTTIIVPPVLRKNVHFKLNGWLSTHYSSDADSRYCEICTDNYKMSAVLLWESLFSCWDSLFWNIWTHDHRFENESLPQCVKQTSAAVWF